MRKLLLLLLLLVVTTVVLGPGYGVLHLLGCFLMTPARRGKYFGGRGWFVDAPAVGMRGPGTGGGEREGGHYAPHGPSTYCVYTYSIPVVFSVYAWLLCDLEARLLVHTSFFFFLRLLLLVLRPFFGYVQPISHLL